MTSLLRRFKLWRAAQPAPYGTRRYWDYRAELAKLEAVEERLAMSLTPFSAVHNDRDPELVLDEILSCRDLQVDLMRRIGWAEAADRLAEDTARRRVWRS